MFWQSLRKWFKLRAAVYKVKLLLPHLTEGRVLDVGTGNGGLEKSLKAAGVDIYGLDIKNKSLFEDITPTIYAGEHFPFSGNAFDTSLIITVLHHTPTPELILKEAQRCSQKIIIIEDIYTNTFQKHLTFFMDSLVNWEWKGHPHSNKTDTAWRLLFQEMNLKLTYTKQYSFLLLFRQSIYVLER